MKRTGYLACVAGLCLFSCIERDNPFDPANLPSILPGPIKEGLQPSLDRFWARAIIIRDGIREMNGKLLVDDAALTALPQVNDPIRAQDSLVRDNNATLKQQNEVQTDPALLVPLSFMTLLSTFQPAARYDSLGAWSQELEYLRAKALAIIDSVNLKHFPIEIFSAAERASVMLGYDGILDEKSALEADTAAFQGRVTTKNAGLSPENNALEAENKAIGIYNKELEFRRQKGKNQIIKGSDSLVVAIKNLQVGDSLFLDTGTFVGRFPITASGTYDKPILIQGHPNGGTRLTSDSTEIVIIDKQKHIIFRDILFGGAKKNSGVRITNVADSIEFQHCDFIGNAGDGLEIADAIVRISDCRFIGNQKNGIKFGSPTANSAALYLVNSLIVGNSQFGINGVDGRGSVTLTTIADNSGGGIRLSGKIGDFTLYSSIVAYNRKYGFDMLGAGPAGDGFALVNCDIHANDSGSFIPSLPSSPRNVLLDIDPVFKSRDPASYDYELDAASPLLEFEKSGITIGWRKP